MSTRETELTHGPKCKEFLLVTTMMECMSAVFQSTHIYIYIYHIYIYIYIYVYIYIYICVIYPYCGTELMIKPQLMAFSKSKMNCNFQHLAPISCCLCGTRLLAAWKVHELNETFHHEIGSTQSTACCSFLNMFFFLAVS